jgi:tetratricopeptide (TPR) repeat protein
MPEDASSLVRRFLRAQNLEQLGKVNEAIRLYESAIEGRFDSSGPYDRLIALYADRAEHSDVVRVAEAALQSVHTYEDKRAWYERMRAEAIKAQNAVPPALPKKRRP